MPSTYVHYNGTAGSRYRLWVDYTEYNVNVGANTSDVQCTVRMDTTNNYGWFNNGSPGGFLIIDGVQYNFGGGFPNSGVQTFITTARGIAHNSDGSRTINIQGYHNSGVGLGQAHASFNFALTHIPRFATITGFTRDQITDTSFRTNVSTDVACDLLYYSLNGGAWVNVGSGAYTSRSFTIDNLRSNTNYTIRVSVRRQDSGQWTESSTQNVTTLLQNKFFRRVL